MKVYRLMIFSIAILGLLTAPPILSTFQAAEIKTITVATDATWPPMEFVDAQKSIVGLDIDFLKAVAKEAGFKVVFKNTAWDGIFAGIEAGKYDAIISSVTITDERKKTMDFSDPYINAGQILVVPKTTKGVKVLVDLKGKKAGAQIGTTEPWRLRKLPVSS